MTTKLCRKCNTVKSVEDFHKKKKERDGLSRTCKACMSAYSKARRSGAQREEVLQKERESRERNKATRKEYYEANKDCFQAYARERHHAIKDTQEYKEAKRKYRQGNAPALSAYRDKYRRNNLHRETAYVRIHLLEKLNRVPPYIREEVTEAYAKLREECLFLEELMELRYEVDHIIPIRSEFVSGLHVPWNLQILWKRDNIRKGAKHEGPDAWDLTEEDQEELRRNAEAAGLTRQKRGWWV